MARLSPLRILPVIFAVIGACELHTTGLVADPKVDRVHQYRGGVFQKKDSGFTGSREINNYFRIIFSYAHLDEEINELFFFVGENLK
jgi:hypothetical protein